MIPEKIGKRPLNLTLMGVGLNKCALSVKNKTNQRAYIVMHDVVTDDVRELTLRRSKSMKVPKGTYVIEAWLENGNIGINPENIQHVKIEDLPSNRNTSFRGKRLVVDFIHDRDQMVIFEEITVNDIIRKNSPSRRKGMNGRNGQDARK